jgi:hypothetical protein
MAINTEHTFKKNEYINSITAAVGSFYSRFSVAII